MAFNTREENAADLAFEEEQRSIQGVCKDCGNGTLNNDLNPAFDSVDNRDEEDGGDTGMYCLKCGSTHLDIL